MEDRRIIPEAEHKLVILYAMDKLGPVTAMQLLQFMAELDLMNYFTMQINLCEMEEQGQLTQRAHPLGSLLLISPSGTFTLDSFSHRIPASRRQLIDDHAPVWHERFRAEQQTPADSFPLRDGSICLRLRLMEGDVSLMEVLLTVGADSSLPFLQRRWRAAAHDVYAAVFAALTAGFDAAAPAAPASANVTLQQSGTSEWFLSFEDPPSLTLLITLPDEKLARHCASRWGDHAGALHALILRELQESLPERIKKGEQ